jgi:hypothetical protein
MNNNNRNHIDPSKLDPQISDSMAVLAAFVMYTGQPNLRAGIEVAGRFFAIEVTEVPSKEALVLWNGEKK